MNRPVTQAEVLLRKAVADAEVRAGLYMARLPTSTDKVGDKSDHETAVCGDIADAIDAIAPGLGMRFMQAMHPDLDLCLDGEFAAAALIVLPIHGAMQ